MSADPLSAFDALLRQEDKRSLAAGMWWGASSVVNLPLARHHQGIREIVNTALVRAQSLGADWLPWDDVRVWEYHHDRYD